MPKMTLWGFINEGYVLISNGNVVLSEDYLSGAIMSSDIEWKVEDGILHIKAQKIISRRFNEGETINRDLYEVTPDQVYYGRKGTFSKECTRVIEAVTLRQKKQKKYIIDSNHWTIKRSEG